MAAPSSQDGGVPSKPLFLRVRDLPATEDYEWTVLDICRACEKVAGHGSMDGAQRIGLLFRLYISSSIPEARAKLLISGIALNGVLVKLSEVNPFVLRDRDGGEIPNTKVTVSDIPISYSSSEIEDCLKQLGCHLLSNIRFQHVRDENGKLTRFKNGNRFLYIAVPKDPLPKQVKIGLFNGKLYHKEQKVNSEVRCWKCLQVGHHSFECDGEIVCLTCKTPGHRRGDAKCPLLWERRESVPASQVVSDGWGGETGDPDTQQCGLDSGVSV